MPWGAAGVRRSPSGSSAGVDRFRLGLVPGAEREVSSGIESVGVPVEIVLDRAAHLRVRAMGKDSLVATSATSSSIRIRGYCSEPLVTAPHNGESLRIDLEGDGADG